MQKWEYLFVTAEFNGGEWRVRWMNHTQEITNWKKGPPIVIFVNQIGNDGWELVNSHVPYTTGGLSGTGFIYGPYLLEFKRPKP